MTNDFLMLQEMQWVHLGVLMLIGSLFLYVFRTLNSSKWVWHMAWALLAGTVFSLVASIWLRSIEAEYFALSNMYESLMVLSIGMMLGFLVMDRWFALRSLGWPVCLVLLVMVGYATTLPTDIHPLQAALQSYWRAIHVPVILLSYSMFTLSFVSSIIYLVKAQWGSGSKNMTPATALPSGSLDGRAGDVLSQSLSHQVLSHDLEADLKQRAEQEGSTTAQVEAADIYDEITYRCIAVGFPLLAIGIILGGLWANEAWGNYWSWDPKESMSLVTLLAYGVYLHMRVNGEHSAKTLAWVSVAGYIMMLITYFGVNLMGLGLHSYGKIG